MVTPTPVQYRKGKRKLSAPPAPPPVVGLQLTAASADIEDDFANVTLRFDRAIDVSAIVVTAIQVGTISTSQLYQGDGLPTVVDAMTVRIALVPYDSYEPSNVMLFAGANSGIVAVDNGGTWSGTGGTELPFA